MFHLRLKIRYDKNVNKSLLKLVQWCPDLVYPDLVDCRDLVD